MSYFMTVTGNIPNVNGIEGIKFVSAGDAQEYIAKIIKQFPPEEAAKTFFIDDGSLTSHDLINEVQESLILGRPFKQTRLGKLLDACLKINCKVRIWWANNDPDAFRKVECLSDKKLFIEMLTSKLKQGEDVYLLYEPSIKSRRE